MSRHFELTWSDLLTGTQETILSSVIETLNEKAKPEGEEIKKRDW